MAESAIFQNDDTIAWQDLGNGIKRKMYGFNEQLMLVRVKFEKGAVGTLHQHPHTQVSYVEEGLFELEIGAEKRILKKGDGYFVPPNIIHGCVCLEAGILVDSFSPYREEFFK